MSRLKIAAVLLAVVVGVIAVSTFTVDERERVIKFQLGEIVRTDFEPGLYFKIPFVNNIRRLDARVLTLDATPERYLTSEKKNVIVDSYVKWRIGDTANYYRATKGDELRAGARLAQIIKDELKSQIGNRTIKEVISGERAEVMNLVRDNAARAAADLGIEILDVRLKQVDLPANVSSSVFRRMEKERATVAKEFRARGEEQAKAITADAERQRAEILADAYAEAQAIRGEGDAQAAETYARAFGQDKEFYSFYRSLEAYKRSFSNKGDVLVLEPDSDFFRYFGNVQGQR